ncbi:MAG: 30S ribosomal protein S20 [Candidatus Hydrogenedentes bacterium]|nr:30S ribosomal protein S20 [Candidatus Hydrogenedentota bacterium]
MANIKSQKKRILTNEKARQRNMAVRSRMRTMIKGALTAIESQDAEKIKAAVPAALSAIDRAAAKGVIHRNSAARKKSSIQHRVATASS